MCMKKSITTPILSMVVVVLVILFFFTWIKSHSQNGTTPAFEKIVVSGDKKSIHAGNEVILPVDDDVLFNWFKTESQLCDESNINSNLARKLFCESKEEFRRATQFKSIVVSPDNLTVGFTIESEALTPDTLVGLLLRSVDGNNSVEFLTNYYLGNEFLSFSPSGKYFVYKSGCFEAMCAFYIKDVVTLDDKVTFIPNEPDARGNYEFVRWITDDEIEYTLNGVTQKSTLQ